MAKQQAHYEVLEKLLQYFEKQDNLEGSSGKRPILDIHGLEFVSYVTFEGVPILPPVMSPLQHDELLLYRKQFIASENRMAAKTKTRLLKRVEDVLTEIEEQQKRVESRQSGITQDIAIVETQSSDSTHQLDHTESPVKNSAIDISQGDDRECEILSAVTSLKHKVLHGYSWDDNTQKESKGFELRRSVSADEGQGRPFLHLAETNQTSNEAKSESLLPGFVDSTKSESHFPGTGSFESPLQNIRSVSCLQNPNTPTPPRLTPTWSAELPKSSPPQKERSSTFTLSQLAEVIQGGHTEVNRESMDIENGVEKKQRNEAIITQDRLETDIKTDAGRMDENTESPIDDQHEDLSTQQPAQEDEEGEMSEPEILVDQSQSEEYEPQTEMTMGLQLLRQKLQQQQTSVSQTASLTEQPLRSTSSTEHRGTLTLSHLPASHNAPVISGESVSASQDSLASSRKQSTALRIQQSLFKAPQNPPPPATVPPSTAKGCSESVASSVVEDLMSTVVLRGQDQPEHPSDEILPDPPQQASLSSLADQFDSDKENEHPDHPLLSRAALAFDGTPNMSPQKPLKADGSNEPQMDDTSTDYVNSQQGIGSQGQVIEGHQATEGYLSAAIGEVVKEDNIASPGPTKTPNLSKISDTDSATGEGDKDESGPYLHSVTTDDLFTKSTELAKYMHASADTMRESLCTLPQIQGVTQGDENVVVMEALTPAAHYEDDVLPSYSENIPIEIETTPVKTGFVLRPVNSHENRDITQEVFAPGLVTEENPCYNHVSDNVVYQEATAKSSSKSSGKSSQERVRRNSYTLDHPSPALVAAQTDDMTANRRKSDLTGSMEDLRIKPVQRKLDLENQGRQPQPYTAGIETGGPEMQRVCADRQEEEVEAGESDTAGVVVLPVDEDAERSGKQEHLQRYLQGLHTSPGLPDTSEDEDSALGFHTLHSTTERAQAAAMTGPEQVAASEGAALQNQVAYFEQLKQQLMQQQQDQVQHLLAAHERQQALFKQELLSQQTRLREKKRMPLQQLPGQAHSLNQDQLQAWVQQLQGFPQLTQSLPTDSPQVPGTTPQTAPHLGQLGQSLPLDALANQLKTLGIQGNVANTLPLPMMQNYISQSGQPMMPQMSRKSPTMGTGSHGVTDMSFGQSSERNLQQLGLNRDPAGRPDSGLSNASTLTPDDHRNLAMMNNARQQGAQLYQYNDPNRPMSDLSYISEELRPQSAPAPRIDGTAQIADTKESGSPAGPSGVYYNSTVPAINAINPDLNTSYQSPVSRTQKVSPLPQPLQSVFTTSHVVAGLTLENSSFVNNHDVTLSSEKSVHFADPVHKTQFIEHQTNTGLVRGGEVYREGYRPNIDLHRCFTKLTAAVRGYLTRRLLHTGKVQQLIKTIRDTAEFAIHFQQESPIKRGVYSAQDKRLQERVINQLTAAMYEIHDIFFETSVGERMMYIQQDRHLERERIFKEYPEQDSAEKKHHQVSAATLKARERKKKMLAAEESLFGQVRPKSAPPSTRSPRKQKGTDLRALKPLQSNVSPRKPSPRENRPASALKDTKAGMSKNPVQRKVHPQSKPQVTKPRTKTTVTSTVAKKIPQSAKLPVRKIARQSTTPDNQSISHRSTTPGVAMPTVSTGSGGARSSNLARNIVNARPIQSTNTPVTTSYSHRGTAPTVLKTAAR